MYSKMRVTEASAGAATAPLVICSFCRNVAWPIGAPEDEASWIAIPAYYRRGGSSDVVVSHGICPGCVEQMFTEVDRSATDLCGAE